MVDRSINIRQKAFYSEKEKKSKKSQISISIVVSRLTMYLYLYMSMERVCVMWLIRKTSVPYNGTKLKLNIFLLNILLA